MVIPVVDEEVVVVSERVRAAVDLVAERVSAAAGAPSNPGVPGRFRMSGVSPDEIGRRLLSGLVEPEDMGGLLLHLKRRVEFLMATIECGDEGEHLRLGATIFMSEVQCLAVGLAFARDGKSSAGAGLERVEVRGVGMDVVEGARVPAHESFARSARPAHGGFPGEVR